MPHVISRRPHHGAPGHARRSILHADPGAHPLQNALALSAVTVGLIALILGFVPSMHFVAAVAGAIGLPLALYSQLISATTAERWLNVVGMVSAFLGLAFALSHGGFAL